MLRIIHISDLHINYNQINNFEIYFIEALKKDLKKFDKENEINIIVFTGDIIDQGGLSFQDISKGFEYFKDRVIKNLSEELQLPNDRFFFVPGNHDIDRNADEKFEEEGLYSYLDDEYKIEEFINKDKTNGINRITKFKEFERNFYLESDLDKRLSNFQSNFITKIGDLNIGITCFNSAWRCYDSNKDKGRILIGEKQVTDSLKFIEKCDIKIALVHHSLDWLANFDMKCCEPIIMSGYNLLMSGHVHESSNWSKTDMYGNIFISTAPSNCTWNLRSDSRIYSNGYTIIDIDLDKDKIICRSRRYNHAKRMFDPNTDAGDDFGIKEYSLPTSEEKEKSNERYDICNKIINIHKEEINDHLLSSNIQINVPKTIEDLYVEPIIKENNEVRVDKNKEKIVKLEELYNSDQNYIVFGEKESGKTLLLDKLIVDLCSKVKKINKIPIYINFKDINNRRIEQIINRYLGIGIREVNALIRDHKIVLLIDNLSYKNNRQINKLIEFIEKNNVQVIATSNTNLNNKIDLELFSYSLFSKFKIVFLELFGSKQIKELASKWFINDLEYNNPEKVKKIVNTLYELRLPRTPLAISMFLWIMGQQENTKPKNYAAMLQNFIEKLFEKTSDSDVYSQDFDYTNKIMLLTDIAYEMYKNNSDNYCMSLVDLNKFIQDNLIAKKFDFDYQEVLNDFIIRGIINIEKVNGISFARFRYNCFFTYMLMNKMDCDQNFFDFVIKKENYLNFVHEIDYFTALKRTRADILIVIFERLQEMFSEKLEIIKELPFGYDSLHKDEGVLLVELIDDNFLNTINTKPTKEDLEDIIDNVNDTKLEKATSKKDISKKHDKLTDFEQMGSLLYLAEKVLKNTEEITINNLKYRSYVNVIRCSMFYNKIFSDMLGEELEKNFENNENIDLGKLQNKFAPTINQMTLYSIMGTNKLKTVIKEKIEEDIKNTEISDYEKFISVFLYADMQGENALNYIKEFINSIKHQYFKDMIFTKLMYYYVFECRNKESEKLYMDIISSFMKKTSKHNASKEKNVISIFDKGKFIDNLKKLKKEALAAND